MSRQIEFSEIDLGSMFSPHSEEGGESFFQTFIEQYANKAFRYYVIETNFNLSARRLRTISNVDGVERLIPVSRYRAIVNFGSLFDVDQVKKEIRVQLSNLFRSKGLRKSPSEDTA